MIDVNRWDHQRVDLTDENLLLAYLSEVRPEIIVHCAAATDVERCEADPVYARAVNVGATQRLAQWAARNGAKLVFISTDSVFDGQAGGYSEEDPVGPLNEYSRTKSAAEEITRQLCEDSLIVRTNFYGWNRHGKPNLSKWILATLLRGEKLSAFTDVRFSPLYVSDLAKLILELIARKARGILHVASQNSCSKYELAVLMGRAFGLDTRQHIAPMLLGEFPFKAQRPKNTSLAVGKCARFLGIELPTVERGIAAFRNRLDATESLGLKRFVAASAAPGAN